MGGLLCSKAIIDNNNALIQATSCMTASILLNASRTQPTEEMEDEFMEATKAVADIASRIEEYVRTGVKPKE